MPIGVKGSSTELIQSTYSTTAATSTRILAENSARTEFRLKAYEGNTYPIYVGKDSLVSTTDYIEIIPPGFVFADSGDQLTVYRGELWGHSAAVDQALLVQEMIRK